MEDPFLPLHEEIAKLKAALAFYADPEEYFAVMIVGDRPCGMFADDVDDFGEEWSDIDGPRHGARARAALGEVAAEQVDAWRAERKDYDPERFKK